MPLISAIQLLSFLSIALSSLPQNLIVKFKHEMLKEIERELIVNIAPDPEKERIFMRREMMLNAIFAQLYHLTDRQLSDLLLQISAVTSTVTVKSVCTNVCTLKQ